MGGILFQSSYRMIASRERGCKEEGKERGRDGVLVDDSQEK